jgi:transcriptional regulator with XRE-family HTH domain
VLSPLVHSSKQLEILQGKLVELVEKFQAQVDVVLAAMSDEIDNVRLAVMDLTPLARLITLTQRQPVKLTEDVQRALRAQFRAVRVTMGLPQAILAQEAGVTTMTVKNFESGRHRPKRTTLRKFAGALLRKATAFGIKPELLDELRTAVDALAPERENPDTDPPSPIDQ